MNDLNLGWNELPAAAQTSPFAEHNDALTHPVLKQTGVSKLTIDGFNGLTIFSANGATIKHAAISVKRSQNVIIRNLEFDELWEWDESSKGDYDKNDWDYITLEETSKVWIDHCTFHKAYDGLVDSKKEQMVSRSRGQYSRVMTEAQTAGLHSRSMNWKQTAPPIQCTMICAAPR